MGGNKDRDEGGEMKIKYLRVVGYLCFSPRAPQRMLIMHKSPQRMLIMHKSPQRMLILFRCISVESDY